MTGHNSMKMAQLLTIFNELGFKNVETYIQSGNVIFSGVEDLVLSDISIKIEKAIFDSFKYKVPVMIRTVKELNSIISSNPFLSENNFEPSKMAVIFLYENVSEAQIQKVINIDYPPDKFKISGREIFIYCPNGFGKTKLYTNFFEKKMSVTGTARNWKTISTIMQIAEKR